MQFGIAWEPLNPNCLSPSPIHSTLCWKKTHENLEKWSKLFLRFFSHQYELRTFLILEQQQQKPRICFLKMLMMIKSLFVEPHLFSFLGIHDPILVFVPPREWRNSYGWMEQLFCITHFPWSLKLLFLVFISPLNSLCTQPFFGSKNPSKRTKQGICIKSVHNIK